MMRRHWRPAAVAAVGMTLLTSCGLNGPATTESAELSDWFTVTSPAFRDGGEIPARFGCPSYGGRGKTPPLRWSGAPADTKAFAIVTDAADSPGGAKVLWLIANIDGTTTELVEGARPDKAVEGQNTSGKTGYTPPCPKRGDRERYRYRYTIYALSEKVQMPQGAALKDSLNDIAKLTIGRGRISGNFGGA
jgi:Raf kinase inhibitor-like YbhB/YbcL family protein